MSAPLRMLPVIQDIEVVRGTTRAFVFTVTLNGSAYNLTGATATLTVKAAPLASGAEVYSLDQASHTNAAGGITTLTIPAAATFGTDGGTSSYVYEFRVTNGSTQIVFFAGAFTVHPTGAPV
jgi:baseplate upper protein BppU